MDGREDYKMVEQVENFQDMSGNQDRTPLIRTDFEEDMMEVCKAIAAFTEEFRNRTAAVHGTWNRCTIESEFMRNAGVFGIRHDNRISAGGGLSDCKDVLIN